MKITFSPSLLYSGMEDCSNNSFNYNAWISKPIYYLVTYFTEIWSFQNASGDARFGFYFLEKVDEQGQRIDSTIANLRYEHSTLFNALNKLKSSTTMNLVNLRRPWSWSPFDDHEVGPPLKVCGATPGVLLVAHRRGQYSRLQRTAQPTSFGTSAIT